MENETEKKEVKAAPANKMQTSDSTKDQPIAEQSYFFPHLGKSATGKTVEEALAKITKSNNN